MHGNNGVEDDDDESTTRVVSRPIFQQNVETDQPRNESIHTR